MSIFVLLLNCVSLALAWGPNLPTVDLGYEIHQATFNVCFETASDRSDLTTYPGVRAVLQFLQHPLCCTSNWQSPVLTASRPVGTKSIQRRIERRHMLARHTSLDQLKSRLDRKRNRCVRSFRAVPTTKYYVPSPARSYEQ